MSFKTKVEKIILEVMTEKDFPEIRKIFLESCAKEFKKEDGMFMEAWVRILEHQKETTIKAALKDILKEMSHEEKIELLGIK